MAKTMVALGGAVEVGGDDAGDAGCFGEETGQREPDTSAKATFWD